jgi:hypothetical protein
MAFTTEQKSNLITEGRQLAVALRSQMNALRDFNDRYVAGGYSLVDGDFVGENAGITAADFTTYISSLQAILTEFADGHDTNVEKVAY